MTDPKLTPPPALVEQWIEETRSHDCIGAYPADLEQCVATRGAQWGADRELDACCEWLSDDALCHSSTHGRLRTARRPKPPSLKEQALSHLENAYDADMIDDTTFENIRQVLEALPE
jgi:hypothetical protein